MASNDQLSQIGPIIESDPSSFPPPERAAILVEINSREVRGILLGIRGSWTSSAVPPAFCGWIQESDHPVEIWLRWCRFAVPVFLIAWCLFGLMKIYTGWPPIPAMWTIPVVLIPLWMSPRSSALRAKVRYARVVLQNRGRVCIRCGYFLHGIPDEHACPECGKPYRLEQLRAEWLGWMTGRKVSEVDRAPNSSQRVRVFPWPEEAIGLVVRNSGEIRSLIWSPFRWMSTGKAPGAFREWFQSTNLIQVSLLRDWVYLVLLAVVVFVMVVVQEGLSAGRAALPFGALIATVALADVLVVFLFGRQIRRKFARYLSDKDGLVCPDCGYLLDALPEAHTCPECGRAYRFKDVRDYWLKWMKGE